MLTMFLLRVVAGYSTTTDWTVRQFAKDRVTLEVKRVLKSHKYPPDDELRAIDTVLEQSEMYAVELVKVKMSTFPRFKDVL